jgi:hypothetical protein
LVGNPEGKRPLRKPRRRSVDNIKTDVKHIGCGQHHAAAALPLGKEPPVPIG